MKIKEGFVTQKIGDKTIVVSTGDLTKEFHGMIELNYTAADIWDWLSEGCSREVVAEKLSKKYDIELSKAQIDTEKLIQKMISTGVIEDV